MQPQTITVDELFSKRLRQLREERGVSQVELARRMAAQGTPFGRVSLLMAERTGRPDAKGKSRKVSIGEALALALALGVSPLAFLIPAGTADEVQIGERRLDHDVLIGWLSGGAELSEETAEMEQELVRLERQLIEARKKYTQFMQATHAQEEDETGRTALGEPLKEPVVEIIPRNDPVPRAHEETATKKEEDRGKHS